MDRRDRDRREISRRDGDSRGSEKRNSEVRGANQRSRSRSREKKREHYGRRASRSRSQDRKRDRVDKDDDKGRNNRGRKSHRSDADRDRDRDNSHKKSSHDNRTDELAKNMKEEVVENYDDSTLKEFEDFITEENVDEVQEAERLALERKLRREQILQKYNMEKTVSAPTLVALSHTSMGRSTFTVQQKITEQTQTQQNGRLNSNIDAAAVSLSTSTSNSLAALVIAESITENIRSKVDDNSAISFQELNASTVVGSILPQSVEFDGRVTKSEISRDNLDEYDREGQLGLGVGTEGTEESFELLNSVARVAVSAPTISFDLSPVTLSSSSVPSNGVHVGNNHSDNGEVERVMLEGDERLAEKNAIKQDARNHKESQPFDMFSSSPSDVERGHKGAGAGNWAGKRALREALLEGEDPHLQSNWDDGEGYYKPRIGELIGEQYQTMGIVGKGVFSVVIKCIDLKVKDGEPVAIKVIRNNDTMRKAAEKERIILSLICDRDPDNKRHCVRLLSHFEFRNHVAMVFDYEQMNLRETLKKFGKDVGINIGAVRMYARQLLVALRHLADLKVVHADIKLDNILCSGDLKQVKLCDFGSAFRETDTDNDPTPYLVSRFYRAPEIILGLPYDRAIDLWSVAVCLYELFTGHVMFPGRTNNEMLRLMMAIKGRFANKQLKSHFRAYEAMSLDSHFDERDLKFKQQELDPVTGKMVQRLVDITQPSKDLASVIRSSKAGSDDGRLVSSLADLLDKCLALDPLKRIAVSDSLKHPFFTLH